MNEYRHHSLHKTSTFVIATYSRGARIRAKDEKRLAAAKLDAYQQFDGEIAAIRSDTVASQQTDPQPRILSKASTTSVLERIRSTFIEYIGPFHDGDLTNPERLFEVLSQEFSPDLAIALATKTESDYFASGVKSGIRKKVDVRCKELESAQAAVEQEQESLKAVEETVLDISSWIIERDETPLLQRGFDDLHSLYKTIQEQKERLDEAAQKRQKDINNSSGNPEVPIKHSLLVEKIYGDFPVSYPALADIAVASRLCTDVQRAVCDHISRRA